MYEYEHEESLPKYCDICSNRIDNEIITIKLPNINVWYHKTCYKKMLKYKNPNYKNINSSTMQNILKHPLHHDVQTK